MTGIRPIHKDRRGVFNVEYYAAESQARKAEIPNRQDAKFPETCGRAILFDTDNYDGTKMYAVIVP